MCREQYNHTTILQYFYCILKYFCFSRIPISNSSVTSCFVFKRISQISHNWLFWLPLQRQPTFSIQNLLWLGVPQINWAWCVKPATSGSQSTLSSVRRVSNPVIAELRVFLSLMKSIWMSMHSFLWYMMVLSSVTSVLFISILYSSFCLSSFEFVGFCVPLFLLIPPSIFTIKITS